MVHTVWMMQHKWLIWQLQGSTKNRMILITDLLTNLSSTDLHLASLNNQPVFISHFEQLSLIYQTSFFSWALFFKFMRLKDVDCTSWRTRDYLVRFKYRSNLSFKLKLSEDLQIWKYMCVIRVFYCALTAVPVYTVRKSGISYANFWHANLSVSSSLLPTDLRSAYCFMVSVTAWNFKTCLIGYVVSKLLS